MPTNALSKQSKGNVTFERQVGSSQWRVRIEDSYTYGFGFGATQREAYDAAVESAQERAERLLRQSLSFAAENFDALTGGVEES